MELTAKELAQLKKAYRLSPRETQVLDLIFQGVDANQDIADRLDITLGTAKRYVHDLYAKVGRNTKLQIALKLFPELYSQAIYKHRKEQS